MTHLELGIDLLNKAARFYEELGAQNESLLEQNPNGILPDSPKA